MTRTLKILTINHHEPYLHSLAASGHDFDVLVDFKSEQLPWRTAIRPLPANFKTVKWDQTIRSNLKNKIYDVVICHTVRDLVRLFPYFGQNYIFIAHIPLFRLTAMQRLKSAIKLWFYRLFRSTHNVRMMAVSEFKRAAWGEEGHVAVLTPARLNPIAAGVGFDRIAVVGNHIRERGEELGYGELAALQPHFPITVIGDNPGIAGAVKPQDFETFQNLFGQHRIYLYLVRFPFGDGYNTAMLEAMAMGMAVVTVPNPSSPIRHGVNGLVGTDINELKAHLRDLLDHPEKVTQMGIEAQKTIATQFSEAAFLKSWDKLLQETCSPA